MRIDLAVCSEEEGGKEKGEGEGEKNKKLTRWDEGNLTKKPKTVLFFGFFIFEMRLRRRREKERKEESVSHPLCKHRALHSPTDRIFEILPDIS